MCEITYTIALHLPKADDEPQTGSLEPAIHTVHAILLDTITV